MPMKKQNPFKLRDYLGVNPDYITRLAAVGVKTTSQMLSAGHSAEARGNLARQADLPLEAGARAGEALGPGALAGSEGHPRPAILRSRGGLCRETGWIRARVIISDHRQVR